MTQILVAISGQYPLSLKMFLDQVFVKGWLISVMTCPYDGYKTALTQYQVVPLDSSSIRTVVTLIDEFAQFDLSIGKHRKEPKSVRVVLRGFTDPRSVSPFVYVKDAVTLNSADRVES